MVDAFAAALVVEVLIRTFKWWVSKNERGP